VKALRKKIGQFIGLDTLAEKYSYETDPRFGFTSGQRVAEKWVATTCGYCSVGCGMLIGVKDGRAVAVQGDVGHSVNEGRLCPKGLC